MGRVAKYRASMSAKAAIERKATQQSSSNNKFVPGNNKKDTVKSLMEKQVKNSR